MFPLSISNWIMVGLAVLAIGGIGYGRYEHYALEKYKVEQADAVHKKELQSQEDADKIRKEKDEKIANINDQLANALVQLRKRPSRSENTANGQTSANCNGASLLAEDAEFLIREASRADQIRVGLDACYKQYDAVAK